MLALVANATQETDAAIVAALAGFWLWRHGKLGRTVRRTGRVAAALVAVVVAVRVSPALCVIACGCVVGAWLARRHPVRRRRHRRESRVSQGMWKILRRRYRRQAWFGRGPRLTSFDVAYHAHMASTAWRRQRDRVVARDGHRCVACGSGYLLNGHHTYYSDPVGREPDSAIVTLCAPCHRTTHLRHELTRGAYHDYRVATRWVIDRSRQKAG